MTDGIKILEGKYVYQIPVIHGGRKYKLNMEIKYWNNDYDIECNELGLHLKNLSDKAVVMKAALKGIEIMIDRAEKLLELDVAPARKGEPREAIETEEEIALSEALIEEDLTESNNYIIATEDDIEENWVLARGIGEAMEIYKLWSKGDHDLAKNTRVYRVVDITDMFNNILRS